jgi:hypothetical protein
VYIQLYLVKIKKIHENQSCTSFWKRFRYFIKYGCKLNGLDRCGQLSENGNKTIVVPAFDVCPDDFIFDFGSMNVGFLRTEALWVETLVLVEEAQKEWLRDFSSQR